MPLPTSDPKAKLAKKKEVRPHGPKGGAKRAFVRLKCLGVTGRPDFARLNEMYLVERAAKSRDYQVAVAMAKAAAAAQKRCRGPRSASAFGARGRALRRSLANTERLAIWQQMQGLSPDERPQAMCDQVVRRAMTLKDSLALARSSVRFAAEAQRAKEEDTMRVLEEWRGGKGAEVVQHLLAHIPSLSVARLRPEPLGPCVGIEVLPPCANTVINGAAWAQASPSTNLPLALEQVWLQTHQTIRHEQCSPVAEVPDAAPAGVCYSAGVCLCNDHGKRAKQLGARLLARLRVVFPATSDRRAKLLEGFIVLRIAFEPKELDYEAILETENAFGEVYFHIGLQYLNPLRPTFLKLELADAGGEAPADDGRIYLKEALCLNACFPP